MVVTVMDRSNYLSLEQGSVAGKGLSVSVS